MSGETTMQKTTVAESNKLVEIQAGLAAQINAEHRAVRESLTAGLAHALKAGELLLDAKALTPHGGFEAWIEASCEFSVRTAQAYMRVARDLPKAQRVADLSFRDAIGLLAEPRIPTGIETEVWFRDENGQEVPGDIGKPLATESVTVREFIPPPGMMLMGDCKRKPDPISHQKRERKRVYGSISGDEKFITEIAERLWVIPSTIEGFYFVTCVVGLGDAGAFAEGLSRPVREDGVVATLRLLRPSFNFWEWTQTSTKPWPKNFWLDDDYGNLLLRVAR